MSSETLSDHFARERTLMSLIGLAIAIGPCIADFNRTHATNPLWPPHARFHVVWQCLIQASMGLIVVQLLQVHNDGNSSWFDGAVVDYLFRLRLANKILFGWLISFIATLVTMPIFGGALRDVNGLPPTRFAYGKRVFWEIESNLLGVATMTCINLYVAYQIY
jgi:hypothetical protein